MNYYERAKEAFSRGIGGVFIPKTEHLTIDRLKKQGYPVRSVPGTDLVKVSNPDLKAKVR